MLIWGHFFCLATVKYVFCDIRSNHRSALLFTFSEQICCTRVISRKRINLHPLYQTPPCQQARGHSLPIQPSWWIRPNHADGGEDRHTRWAYQLLLTRNRDNRETGKEIQRLLRCLAVQVTHTRAHTDHTTHACLQTNLHRHTSAYTLSGMCVEAHMHCHHHNTLIFKSFLKN